MLGLRAGFSRFLQGAPGGSASQTRLCLGGVRGGMAQVSPPAKLSKDSSSRAKVSFSDRDGSFEKSGRTSERGEQKRPSMNILKLTEQLDDMFSSPEMRQATYDSSCCIQRVFRRHRLVFGQLGPALFSRKGGTLADYGSLYFPEKNKTAPFVTVSDTTSAVLLSHFMEKHWKMRRPEVVISVTGGAQDFVLSPRLKRVFDRGLTSAASSTNAWVITGGTDTGVMKLVASAFAEYGVTTPLIAARGCDSNPGTPP